MRHQSREGDVVKFNYAAAHFENKSTPQLVIAFRLVVMNGHWGRQGVTVVNAKDRRPVVRPH
jgi:hypothetical protein